MGITDPIITTAGTLLPGSHYDLTLVHDGHDHVLPNVLVGAFMADTVRYQVTDGQIIGFLPEQVTALALHL